MGVGYRAQQSGAGVSLAVGYSHPVEVFPFEGLTIEVEGNNLVHVRGINKQEVGELAAQIRKYVLPTHIKKKGLNTRMKY